MGVWSIKRTTPEWSGCKQNSRCTQSQTAYGSTSYKPRLHWCRQSKNIIETTRIAKLPKILILSLQKTNKNNTRKYLWDVKYDKEFGIKEIVDQDLSKDDPALYQHFAINNHCGYSPISGHYWSSIFLEKYKAWYCFDDERVSKEDGLTYSSTNYILFYKQKHN